VRFASRDHSRDRAFRILAWPRDRLEGVGLDNSGVARPSFGRGLCILKDRLVAAGSSPSTISLHDLESGRTALTVTLSTDVRNAIHGLEPWPFS
jgi:hypothetical protein